MAGLIPQDFIDDLLSRTDIVDVVGDHVQLRKAGKDFQGLCPFHNEKSPSFTVSQVKQFYHCFGCQASGSAISFLMEHNHLDFVETIKELASKAGMQLPENTDSNKPRINNDPVYNILGQTAKFFATQLRQHSTKQRAVDYLKNRGLSGEIAKAYDIGYAPDGWDHLLKHFDKKQDQKSLLMKAGLIIEKESENNKPSRHYDRFRDRIMFPIRDYKGRVIGFGGRILDKGEPKYLNSPETPVFHKGRELYGLFEARKRCRDLDQIIVVEGYMDVVALAQFGVNHSVATLGTATTTEHLQRLFKTTKEVIFCFDGDRAGKRAAWKALDLSLPLLKEGYSVQFLFLAEGEDPDSMVRSSGPEYFRDSSNFTALSDFLFNSLMLKADINTLEGRAQLVDLANPLVSKIPTGALRSLMQQRLSKLSELEGQAIEQIIPEAAPPIEIPRPRQRALINQNKRLSKSLVEQAIHIILNHPNFASEVEFAEELVDLLDPFMPLLLLLLQVIKTQPTISTGQLLEHWRGTETLITLNELIAGTKELPEEAIQTEYVGIITTLKKNLLKQQRSAIINTSEGKITDRVKNIYKRPENE